MVAALAWTWVWKEEQATRDARSELLQLRAQEASERTAASPERHSAYAVSARQMLAHRQTEWVGALSALEAIPPANGLVIQEIAITSSGAGLQVQVAAANYPALIEWLSTLNAESAGHMSSWRWELTSATAEGQGELRANVLATRTADLLVPRSESTHNPQGDCMKPGAIPC